MHRGHTHTHGVNRQEGNGQGRVRGEIGIGRDTDLEGVHFIHDILRHEGLAHRGHACEPTIGVNGHNSRYNGHIDT